MLVYTVCDGAETPMRLLPSPAPNDRTRFPMRLSLFLTSPTPFFPQSLLILNPGVYVSQESGCLVRTASAICPDLKPFTAAFSLLTQAATWMARTDQ